MGSTSRHRWQQTHHLPLAILARTAALLGLPRCMAASAVGVGCTCGRQQRGAWGKTRSACVTGEGGCVVVHDKSLTQNARRTHVGSSPLLPMHTPHRHIAGTRLSVALHGRDAVPPVLPLRKPARNRCFNPQARAPACGLGRACERSRRAPGLRGTRTPTRNCAVDNLGDESDERSR